MLLFIYRIFVAMLLPILYIIPHYRSYKGKEIKKRICERYGIATKDRPQGKLVWIHAASNGEALSALPLIERLQDLPSAPFILVTTMTVTSAKLMQDRLPKEGCLHQFIPLDVPSWINRFHDHWKPDAVFWIESELWPNHLNHLQKNNIPATLINARLSDNSLKKWSVAKQSFSSLLGCFSMIFAQTNRDKKNLENLGIGNVESIGNLKDSSLPLPYDAIAFDDARLSTANKRCVLFASTHEGEESIAVQIHKNLKNDFPDLLSIIVPRHPKRGHRIFDSIQNEGLNIALRSLKMSPRTDTDIYIADTLGELGLFYRLCDISFVGNSMHVKPGGGHNLLEPALLNCAIISGDDLHNFSILKEEMPNQNACLIARNEKDLENSIRLLLSDNNKKEEIAGNALQYALEKKKKGLDNLFISMNPLLKQANLL